MKSKQFLMLGLIIPFLIGLSFSSVTAAPIDLEINHPPVVFSVAPVEPGKPTIEVSVTDPDGNLREAALSATAVNIDGQTTSLRRSAAGDGFRADLLLDLSALTPFQWIEWKIDATDSLGLGFSSPVVRFPWLDQAATFTEVDMGLFKLNFHSDISAQDREFYQTKAGELQNRIASIPGFSHKILTFYLLPSHYRGTGAEKLSAGTTQFLALPELPGEFPKDLAELILTATMKKIFNLEPAQTPEWLVKGLLLYVSGEQTEAQPLSWVPWLLQRDADKFPLLLSELGEGKAVDQALAESYGLDTSTIRRMIWWEKMRPRLLVFFVFLLCFVGFLALWVYHKHRRRTKK